MRMGGFVVLVTVVCACVVAARAADGRTEGKVRVRASKPGPAPRRLFALPRRAEAAAEVVAYPAKVGDTPLVLLDLDGDGRLAPGTADAWRVDDDDLPFAFPLESTVVVDDRRTELVHDVENGVVRFVQDESAWPASVEARGRDARAVRSDILRSLTVWNRLRMRNGLPPVHLDGPLTAACMDHARYMERWGVTHVQDPEKDGYTVEGDRVARSGSVGSLAASDEIVEVYSTFYHRISLFHPGTRGAGIGSTGSRSVFNGTEDRVDREWTWPVIIPAPETDDVPRTYHREKPVPHLAWFEDGTISQGGFPITLTFERDAISDVRAELRIGGHDGDAVPFELSWPEKPASPDAPTNYKSICLLPHAPLRARTTYWVHVEWTYRRELDQRTWTFTTGR